MTSRETHWLRVIIGAHLILGLLYDWATPIFEASDEGAHYAVIHWLAQGRSLPVQEPGTPEKPWAQEGSQPPLYYFLGASLTAWVDTRDFEQVFVRNPYSRVGIPGTTHNVNLYRHPVQPAPLARTALAVRLVRWFSLALSGVTIYLTARLARRVFPNREGLACLAAALVAFNPMTLFINASVNNDNLLMLLSTAALLVIVDIMQTAPASSPDTRATVAGRGRPRSAAALGLLLGLAALTKVSGLVLWPVAALGVGWGIWRKAEGGRRKAARLLITDYSLLLLAVFGVALLVCGWWFWRNDVLYGEWLGLNTMVAAAGPRVPPITLWQLIRDEWEGFWLSYWGIFGVFTIRAGDWVYLFFDALTLWAVAGGVWALFRSRQWPRPALLLFGLFCMLTLVGVVRWTLQTFASQGRLMFGAIAPLSIFMAGGIMATLELLPPHRKFRLWNFDFGLRGLGVGILIFLLALIAAPIPILYIAPRYAPPPSLTEADLPADLRPVHATFDGAIELIGYQADDTPRRPGESQPVTLYWRALKPMASDYPLALFLLGQSADTVGKIDTWPGGGRLPTSQWQANQIFADSYALPIQPESAAPSVLRLNLKFWEGNSENILPITTPNGEALRSVTVSVGRITAAQPLIPVPTIPIASTFDGGITLIGMNMGQNGAFTLYWQTSQLVSGDYTVFAHLLDAGWTQVTQKDSQPLNNDWPTSAWIPGQAFAEVRQFDLPDDLPPGLYTIRLGLYEPASGVRLAAYRPDGTRWPEDGVVIKDVVEIR